MTMKRTNISVYPDIEVSLFNSFIQRRDLNVFKKRVDFKQKNWIFATKLGHKHFKSSHRVGHAIVKDLNNAVFRKNV